MGNPYWRERHYKENWTKPVDISYLYQLQMISEEMKKRAKNDEDRRLEEWANQIRLIVARASGEEVNVKLTEYEMPETLPTEDEVISLPPPPRPRRLPKPSVRAST
jgi:hypothetical protein